jgi:hypothetical protein
MANLIEQMNVLKGLDDASLQTEVSTPTGSVPPWLALTEINRRKDMRQRYDAEAARKKPSTTVVEDITFGLPAMPASTQGMPGGIGDAVEPVQGFASGGLVDAAPGYAAGGEVSYDSLQARYNDRLQGLTGDKDRARALALLAASGAILGGGSSNTLKNVGGGISAFAGQYGDALKTIDSEEIQLLRGVTDLEQLQQNFAASEADRALRREEIGISRERLTTDKTPADILKFEAFQKMSPEDKAEYLRLNPPYNPNAVTGSERLADDLDRLYNDAQKLFPITAYDTPEIAAEKQKKAQAVAYQRIVASRGKLIADEWAANQGIAIGDLVVGDAAAVLDEKDPLGLGL